MSSAKKKVKLRKSKNKISTKTVVADWTRIKTFPTQVFQTLRGPIIARVEWSNAKATRMWAPAFITHTGTTAANSKVVFLPVGFCEDYMDIFATGVMGINAVPAGLTESYEDYFDNFAKGEYRIQTLHAGIEGEEISLETKYISSTENTVALE